MKRLIIICEGETEQELCVNMLWSHFQAYDIQIECPLIKKSMGGIVSWKSLGKQIRTHLSEHAYVTTFIDLYGIKQQHQFPLWEDAIRKTDKYELLKTLEDGMRKDIGDYHFIPYIQLHEFEALLFNNKETFLRVIPEEDISCEAELDNVLSRYPNPELINNSPETSPSHRLQHIIPSYDKVLYGYFLAEDIGLDKMRKKCPHFNEWLSRLENLQSAV